MSNFKRQKAIMGTIDWDLEHMRDRITVNAGNTTTPSNTFINSPSSDCGGMVVGADGHVYMIPYSSKNVYRIDTSDNSKYTLDMTAGSNSTSDTHVFVGADTEKYFGGVLASNGYIYCVPYDSSYILKIDTNHGSSTYGKLSRITFSITSSDCGSSGNKWRGGVLAPNGCIYCAPYNATCILKIDTCTDEVSYIQGDFVKGLLGVSQYFYSGAVLAPDGWIVCVPYGAKRILYFNVEDEELKWSTYDSISTSTGNRWVSGVYDPKRDKIMCIPNEKSLDIMEIQINSQGSLTISTNPYYTPASVNYGNAVIASNGNCYLLPKSTGAQCYELSSNANGPNRLFGTTDSALQNWHAILAPNGKIYSAGYNSKINVISPNPSSNLNFGLSTILSPYLNKF